MVGDGELDEYGCLQPLNNAAKTFNAQLCVLYEQLRPQLTNATIVYVDIYSIKYDLIASAPNYGMVIMVLVLISSISCTLVISLRECVMLITCFTSQAFKVH